MASQTIVPMSVYCEPTHAINFEKIQKHEVAHLTAMTIGADTEFAADQPLTSPIDDSDVKVVAVITSLDWDGTRSGTIRLTGLLSNANKNFISDAKTAGDPTITLAFEVYKHDETKSVPEYFIAWNFQEEPGKGFISTDGTELVLKVAAQADPSFQSPPLYEFEVEINPDNDGDQQAVHYAEDPERNQSKAWGMPIGA